MMWRRWEETAGAAGLVIAAALSGGCYRPNLRFVAQEEKIYRLEVGPGQIVELWTGHGSIEVKGEPRPDLTVRARFSALGVTQEEADQRLHLFRVVARTLPLGAVLHVELDSGGAVQGLMANLEAAAPRDAALRLAACGGPVHVTGVRGPIEAETDNGSIVLRGMQGAVRARTSDGGVVGEELWLDGAGGLSRFETAHGSVRLEVKRLEHPLQIECRAAPVDLILPAAGTYAFDLETRRGSIVIRSAEGTLAESAAGKRLLHQTRTGGVPVVVRTSLGDVLVRLRSETAGAEDPRGSGLPGEATGR